MNDRELSCHIIRPHQTVVCLSHILIFPSSFSSFTFPFLWAQALPPPEQTQSYTTECLVISSSCWFLTAKLCSGQSLFLLLVDGASLSLSWWSIYFKKKKEKKKKFFQRAFRAFFPAFFCTQVNNQKWVRSCHNPTDFHCFLRFLNICHISMFQILKLIIILDKVNLSNTKCSFKWWFVL